MCIVCCALFSEGQEGRVLSFHSVGYSSTRIISKLSVASDSKGLEQRKREFCAKEGRINTWKERSYLLPVCWVFLEVLLSSLVVSGS